MENIFYDQNQPGEDVMTLRRPPWILDSLKELVMVAVGNQECSEEELYEILLSSYI